MVFWNLFDGILLLALATCIFFWPTQLISDEQNRRLRLGAVGLVAVQLIIDGPRVQLLPAYLIALFFAVLLIPRKSMKGTSASREALESYFKKAARWFALMSTAFFLLLSILYCVFFPRVEYPKPSGQYAIGVHSIRLIDQTRDEPNTASANDRRELFVRITYPATASPSDASLKRDVIPSIAVAAPNYALRTRNPISPLWHAFPLSWSEMETNGWTDAPVAESKRQFPVIVFSHGLGLWPEQHTVWAEELASYGFIVVSINHAGLSGGFLHSNGSMIGVTALMNATDATPLTKAQSQHIAALEGKLTERGKSLAERIALLKEQSAIRPDFYLLLETAHRVASADQKFVLDELVRINASDSVLKARLNLDRLGIAGMSMGGTTSQLTCSIDTRCRAGLNMDGFHTYLVDLSPMKSPFMYMAAERNVRGDITHELAEGPNYLVRIKGTAHSTYTDLGLIAPRLRFFDNRGIDIIGSIDNARARYLINGYAVAFFNKHLNGEAEPLLDQPSGEFAEVTFRKK